MNNYFMTFKLTNFYGSRVEMVEDENGGQEECVVIPLARNGLKVCDSNGAVYVNAFVNSKDQRFDRHTHYITQYCVKEHLANLRELGYEAPRLGHMDASVYKTSYHKNTEIKDYGKGRVKMEY